MRKLWMMALACAIGGAALAQENWCGFDHLHQQEMDQNPASRQAVEEYLNQVHQGAALNRSSRAGEKVIVPTVVHVTYSDCDADISLAQIQDALRVLNDDYNRLNPDTNLTRSEFMPYAASTTVEFRLAQIDPNGNPTEGINHIQTNLSVNASNNIKSVEYWPSNKYFNIWVVESIQNFTGGAGTILGYAQFPNSGNWSTYGIVIRNDAMGTIGTSSADGRTLTHEVGHCLGLFHTFQSGCGSSCTSSGDYICDTPPAQSDPTYDCNFATNTCANDQVGSSPYSSNVPDQIENYMSYNSCQNMFSIGQRDVMVTTLETVSTLQNLTSESNLIATGVVGLVKADAQTDKELVCEGNAIQVFNTASYDADIVSWNFGGNAIPSLSSIQNPEVVFYESGLQSIDFDMSLGTQTVSGSHPIFVLNKMGQFAPFVDDMESQTAFPSNEWFGVNADLDDHEWQLTNQAAFSGEQSLMVDNFGNCATRNDRLYTQSFDFSPYSSIIVSFKSAFAQVASGDADFLRASVSTDCGETWSLVWVRGGASLAGSNSPQTTAFFPTSSEQWQTQSFNLNASHMTEGAIIRIEFVGRGGNNVFIDDFSLSGTFSGELLLQSPENNKQGLSTDVTLDWKAVGGVSFYEYQLDVTPDFNSASLIAGTKNYIDNTPANTDTEFEASGLNPATTYYWRVRYNDGSVYSDWSETWKFEVSETGVGIDENTLVDDVKLYPNPAQNQATIESNVVISSVQIMDYTGRILLSQSNVNATQQQLDLTNLGAGMYLVLVKTETGNQTVKTLVVH